MKELPTYSVFAIKYATVRRNANEKYIGADFHETLLSMYYYIWVIMSDDVCLLVDTGFNFEMAKQRGRNFLRCPIDSLKLLDINIDDISTVILTHLHYDHAGNLELLPTSNFILQDREVMFATGRNMRHNFLRQPYDVGDIVNIVKSIYSDRVTFINGEAEIFPGINVHHVGGHCDGLQVVQVWTEKGWLVLASDASHYYDNFKLSMPFPIVYNAGDMLQGFCKISELASDNSLIIPGHDPRVMDLFDAPKKALEGIVVKLA